MSEKAQWGDNSGYARGGGFGYGRFAERLAMQLAHDAEFWDDPDYPPLRRRDRLPFVGRRFRRRYLNRIGYTPPTITIALFDNSVRPEDVA